MKVTRRAIAEREKRVAIKLTTPQCVLPRPLDNVARASDRPGIASPPDLATLFASDPLLREMKKQVCDLRFRWLAVNNSLNLRICAAR